MSSGPPVLLLHSSGLSGRQWSRWELPGRRRLVPDLWGCGARGPWPGPWPFRLAANLELVLELLAGHGPVDLVGHSYGGVLALYAAAVRPDLVRAVAAFEPPLLGLVPGAALELPPGFSNPAASGTEAWLESFVDWWNGSGAWSELAEPVRASLRGAGREAHGQVTDLLADRRTLAAYAALPPTLLLRGSATPAPVAEALERLATLPQVRLERIAGVGHMAPLVRPDLVEPHVAAFLRG